MNAVKRIARRYYLQRVKPTGPNRFKFLGIDKEKNNVVVPTSKTLGDIMAINEKSQNPQPVSNQIPGSMRGSSWIRENKRRRSVDMPQLRG